MSEPIGPELRWAPGPRPGREPLHGEHVLLRPLEPADATSLWEVTREDPGLWTYMADGPYGSVEEMQRWLQQAAASEDPLYFAIVRDGRALGRASYMRITPEFGVIEIGNIVFAPELQRTTAATEAIYLLARHAFDELGYRRLEWKCDALNARSRRAADRFGFSFDGVFRQHMVVKGRNRDTAWYSILDAEWPAIRAGFEAWLQPGNFGAGDGQRTGLSALIAQARGA
jgi:RimJ/RimL family protein N-acetyltransferase